MYVEPVTVEHHREPLGFGETAPRLSWVTRTKAPGWTQRAYEIEIDRSSTGRVESAESVLVPWPADRSGGWAARPGPVDRRAGRTGAAPGRAGRGSGRAAAP